MSVATEKTSRPATEISDEGARAKSLTKVLSQNERAKELVEEAAEELSSVNKVLKQELAKQNPPPEVEKAVEKSEAVEEKVQTVSNKLAVVNRALEGAVKDRVMLEHQFAAVTEQEQAARHDALHDPLTGLANRMLFHDRLEHGLAQAQRHGWNLAVMFLDLDGFKAINDTHGHDVGDAVLRCVSARLTENTRNDDTISRHGGDEFLYLLMEHRDQQDVASIAEKFINVIRAPCDLKLGELNVVISVEASIGIAIFPKDGATSDELVKSADQAMYQAKRSRCGYSFVP